MNVLKEGQPCLGWAEFTAPWAWLHRDGCDQSFSTLVELLQPVQPSSPKPWGVKMSHSPAPSPLQGKAGSCCPPTSWLLPVSCLHPASVLLVLKEGQTQNKGPDPNSCKGFALQVRSTIPQAVVQRIRTPKGDWCWS